MIAATVQGSVSGNKNRFKRGACPSLAEPMRTGDGLLVRFRLSGTGLPPSAIAKIAELSAAYGNGLIEITARGNIQIRGLGQTTARLFSSALERAGIVSQSGVSIETPPLADIDPAGTADPGPLAGQIRAMIAEHGATLDLPPKLSIVVDGGGTLNLRRIVADIRLDAIATPASPVWRLSLAGTAASARAVALLPADNAADAVMNILSHLSEGGRAMRGRDLNASEVRSGFGFWNLDIPDVVSHDPPGPIGVWEMAGETVLGIGLCYGRTTTEQLAVLMRGLETLGAYEIRPTHEHAFLVRGIEAEAMEQAQHLARTKGFRTEHLEPANFLSVCTGSRGCASGTFDTRALADRLLAEVPGLFDGSITAHISGCPKGCAHPTPAELTVSGLSSGIGLVVEGRACDKPVAVIPAQGTAQAFARLEALIQHEKREGETVCSVFDRIGRSRLIAAFQQGRK